MSASEGQRVAGLCVPLFSAKKQSVSGRISKYE